MRPNHGPMTHVTRVPLGASPSSPHHRQWLGPCCATALNQTGITKTCVTRHEIEQCVWFQTRDKKKVQKVDALRSEMHHTRYNITNKGHLSVGDGLKKKNMWNRGVHAIGAKEHPHRVP